MITSAGDTPNKPADVKPFENKRIAIEFILNGERKYLFGTAVHVRDDTLGEVLRIRLEDDGPLQTEILVAETQWEGLIVSDSHDCDFRFPLAESHAS